MKFPSLRSLFHHTRRPVSGAIDILRYIGPGLLVTVGFIDPGNWASDLAASSLYGLSLLWVVTLSTFMLILLQHNVAHLGIASGLCMAEATTKYMKKTPAKIVLASAMTASVATSLAEIIGGAIALQMLFGIPIKIGAVLVTAFAFVMLLTQGYKMIERWIIAFVSVIGISFIYELMLVHVNWPPVMLAVVKPSFPKGSLLILLSVLGAVVMPHNIFLHSEVIQSRQWNLEDEKTIRRQMNFEFIDTLFSMIAGWAINCAIIILAATAFYNTGIAVTDLVQAKNLLIPLLGQNAATVFAAALLLAGISASITSGMAGGTISAGFFGESFDLRDIHSRIGAGFSLIAACLIVFFISDPFQVLILSQAALSIQLPITIWLQFRLTSDKKVMGRFVNGPAMNVSLIAAWIIVTGLNAALVWQMFF